MEMRDMINAIDTLTRVINTLKLIGREDQIDTIINKILELTKKIR
jgi:uncharacterized protein YlzI (FlbEa/FlbD family)